MCYDFMANQVQMNLNLRTKCCLRMIAPTTKFSVQGDPKGKIHEPIEHLYNFMRLPKGSRIPVRGPLAYQWASISKCGSKGASSIVHPKFRENHYGPFRFRW